MKRLQKCCYCATTRTGTLILAWLGVVLGGLEIVGAWTDPMTSPEVDPNSTRTRSLLTLGAVVAVILSVLLIVGVKQRRSWLMLPWLIAGVIQAVVYVVVVETHFSRKGHVASVIGILIAFCIFFYLWGVVLSHYLDTRDEENNDSRDEA